MFGKELKKALFTIPCLLLFGAMFLFYASQLGDYLTPAKKIVPPEAGQSYGTVPSDDPKLVMPAALQSLYAAFVSNQYTTYPLGFYRQVRLGEEKQEQMAELLASLSGKTRQELLARQGGEVYQEGRIEFTTDENGNLQRKVSEPTEETTIFPAESLSYGFFQEKMAQADALLGGGTSYAPERLSGFGKRAKTYEEAMAEYESARDTDGFIGAHARLFSDFLTIFAAWLPAFLMVSECLRDRRANMRELIWVKKASSLSITLCRYGAVVLLSMLPVFLLAGADTLRAAALYAGESLPVWAYLSYGAYALGWILPTVLFSASVGLFFTELTDTPIGLAAILLLWFLDLNRGMAQMDGGYGGLVLIPRHNSLWGAAVFSAHLPDLAVNRLFYLALSLALVGAAALILEYKRKGRWFGLDDLRAYFRHRKGVSAA